MIVKKPWFTTKRFGWGWGLPLKWQGWVVYIAYFGFVVWDFRRIDSASHSVSDTLYGFTPGLLVATILLIVICYLTGEKPRWRWGK